MTHVGSCAAADPADAGTTQDLDPPGSGSFAHPAFTRRGSGRGSYDGPVLRALMVLIPLALTLYALIDCIRTDESLVKGLPKIVWVLIIILLWVVGPLAWIFAGRDRTWEPPRRAAPPRPVAPDDDPDFLRDLDVKRRRESGEEPA